MICGATLENDFSARIQVSRRNWGLEIGDRGYGHGRFLLGVILFSLVGLIVDLGEEFGSDATAAGHRAELCVIDRGTEGVLS